MKSNKERDKLLDSVQFYDLDRGSVIENGYRYLLWERWDPSLGTIAVIGINPSEANAVRSDATFGKCLAASKRWGYGTLIMANLFGHISRDQEGLTTIANPIGPRNDDWLRSVADNIQTAVAAWGSGSTQGRDQIVIGIFQNMECIRINGNGSPLHPRSPFTTQEILQPYARAGAILLV